MQLGVDLERVHRFELPRESSFLQHNFSPEELTYAYSKTQPSIHLCGMFCAKEAVRKTLDGSPIEFTDIVVHHDPDGTPRVSVAGERPLGADRFLLSISHCDDYGLASAVRLSG